MRSASSNPISSMTRVLFLHGMFLRPELYQAEIMVELLGKLKQTGMDVVFLKSPRPHSAPVWPMVLEAFSNEEEDYPEWYNSREQADGSKVLDGLDGSIEHILSFLATEDPFDVIMGHSQGAQLASILTLRAQIDPSCVPKEKRWRLVVPMNAPNSFETVNGWQEKALEHKIKMPSLHVFGGTSDMTWEGQQKLKAVHYEEKGSTTRVIQHDNGHMPPKGEKTCNEIVESIQEMLK